MTKRPSKTKQKQKQKPENSHSLVSKPKPEPESRPRPKTLSLWPPDAIESRRLFNPLYDDDPSVYGPRENILRIIKRIQEKNPEFFYDGLRNNNSTLSDELKDHIIRSIEKPNRELQRTLESEHLLRQHTQKLQEHDVSKQNSMLPEIVYNILWPEPKIQASSQDTPRKPGVPESPQFYNGVPPVSKGGKTQRNTRHKNRRKTHHNNK